MMPRLATRYRLAALTLVIAAVVLAWHHWITAVVLAYLAVIAVVIAGGSEHHDRTIRDQHDRAREAAGLDDKTLAAPPPCCSFWLHSDGQVHGPDCARPPLPRREKGSAA